MKNSTRVRKPKFNIENNTTEFKSELNDKLEKEVVAFLNSEKGGCIYIGVKDDGEVCGIADVDKAILAITDRIKNNIRPSCLGLFDVFSEEFDDKIIIHIVVTRGTEKPYYLKKFGQSPKGCFVRVGNGIQPMTTAMIEQSFASRVRNSLSKIPAPINRKLSFQQLKIYYQEKGFEVNDNFLKSLDLYTDDGVLNYVAYLLADENSVSMKVAKYIGIDKCDLVENEEYGYCSLIKATHLIIDKLNIENKTLTRITGAAEREQIRLVDARALRETLINAVVHNDYSSEVSPVVEIYSDRISITSYGGLVTGLNKEECFKGRSMPRNRELMRVFKDQELVVQLGSGMNRILKSYNKDVFNISENFFEVCFKFKHINEAHDEAHDEAHEEAHDEAHDEAHETLSIIEEKIIRACEIERSTNELLEILNYKTRTGNFKRAMLRLCDELKLLELKFPDKPRSKKQKYRLTQKGKTVLVLSKIV